MRKILIAIIFIIIPALSFAEYTAERKDEITKSFTEMIGPIKDFKGNTFVTSVNMMTVKMVMKDEGVEPTATKLQNKIAKYVSKNEEEIKNSYYELYSNNIPYEKMESLVNDGAKSEYSSELPMILQSLGQTYFNDNKELIQKVMTESVSELFEEYSERKRSEK